MFEPRRCDLEIELPDIGWRVCRRCGQRHYSPHQHSPERCYRPCKVWGLGDYVGYCLAAVGLIDNPRGTCGCAQRREWLNVIGSYLAGGCRWLLQRLGF